MSFTPLSSQADPEDTTPRGPYVVKELSLQERAVSSFHLLRYLSKARRRLQLVLAMAVNVDFDYFSRHSEGGYVSQWSFQFCSLNSKCG